MKVVALAGGVGGAKLAAGLAAAMSADDLTVVVNTGDDFEHLGLWISPDLDTVTYTLAGLANAKTGWGRARETWHFMEALEALGGPTWFRLGDADLAMHAERTRRLEAGERLSEITRAFASRLGVTARLMPMSDERVSTTVLTGEGELSFQEYFVARRFRPAVRGVRFDGVEAARPAPGVLDALAACGLVVLCPSNPWVSLDPILAIPGMRQAVRARAVVGVSPIVGGQALKGPAAKMFSDMGQQASALSVADHYRDLLCGLVIDRIDASLEAEIRARGMHVLVTDTIMKTAAGRRRLARQVLGWASPLVGQGGSR
jgi:LPPG:FO 2-phospho-L-lactate transferase